MFHNKRFINENAIIIVKVEYEQKSSRMICYGEIGEMKLEEFNVACYLSIKISLEF